MTKTPYQAFKQSAGVGTIRPQQPDDLFIVCASYEPRSIAVAKVLADDYRCHRAILYCNKEFHRGRRGEPARKNLARLQEIFTACSDEYRIVEGSWLDPSIQLLKMREALSSFEAIDGQGPSVTFDITTFNREALLMTAGLLRTSAESAIRIVYVSPNDFGEWLSRGFREVRNVVGFAGVQNPSLPTLVIILHGFEPERSAKLIDEHEPSKVLIGIGSPAMSKYFYERSISEKEKLALSRQEVEEFQFPTYDIEECTELLSQVIQPYLSRYNVVLSPLSTKISALAAMLVAERFPQIQISYCLPGEYNVEEYSKGEADFYSGMLPQVMPPH